jgi:lipopolysaccharide biosynthesis glycosyltransferase
MNNKIAIFSCGNESYIEQMCVSLTVACRKNSEFVPYIISDVSDKDKIKTIQKLGITLLQADLSEKFKIHNDTWPTHMFWYFIGPEALYQQGFEYSCYIDADVYCTSKLELDWLDGIEIAARSDRENEYNSGVVFFNNKKMEENKLFDTALKVYNKFSTDKFVQWHGGKVHDQQVLTALGKGNPFNEFWGGDNTFNILDLDVTWNYPFQHMKDRNEEHINKDYSELKDEIKFVHFLLSRPWLPFEKWGGTHGLFKTKDFPNGWVVKTNKGEPIRETRIQFVEDWRKEVRKIEKKYECKLFDEFDNLENIL